MKERLRKVLRLSRVGPIALVLIILCAFVVTPATEAGSPVVAPEGAYVFPVRPGSEEWNAFQTHDEMVSACQVPESVLAGMSTAGLVQTVLDYPLLGDFMAYNSMQAGFDYVASNCSALQELARREDAGSRLLERYRAMDPSGIRKNWTLLQKGEYAAEFTYMEMLLAQEPIIAMMTEAEQRELLGEAQKKIEAKEQLSEVYGHFGSERIALVMGRVLDDSGYAPFAERVRDSQELRAFLEDGTAATDEVLQRILPQTESFLFSGASTRDYAGRDYYSYVYTPNGSAVQCIVTTYEFTSSEITYWNNWVAANYPNATRVLSASRKYNCHSWAWYKSIVFPFQSNNRWINHPAEDTYWLDGSYTLWHPPYVDWDDMMVSYVNSDHSARDTNSSPWGKFYSKWGSLPLMYHTYNYCPYNASVLNTYFPTSYLD